MEEVYVLKYNSMMPKILKGYISEIYLLASTIYLWILSSVWFNPILMLSLLLLALLFIFRNKVLGIITGSYFVIITLYLSLAFFGFFQSADTFHEHASQMLSLTFATFALNMAASCSIAIKY